MTMLVDLPVLTSTSSGWRIEVRCEGDCPSSIWYEGDGPVPDIQLVGAAFLLPAAMRAMHVSARLEFRPAISELFAHRLKSAVLPLLARFASDLFFSPPELKFINVVSLRPVYETGSATGMSCGLDSLASARELLALPEQHACRLRLLSHFDTGNHDALHTGDPERLRAPRTARARACASAIGVSLTSIKSNIADWMPGDFARLHTVRNLAAAHLLAGSVRHYFYANGVRISQTTVKARDTAYIDSVLVPLLSTEVLQFHQSTPDCGAPQKVEMIADWDIAHRFLNVCYFEDTNCGECEKCLRRMLLLDAAGALKKFGAVFPEGALARQRDWYLGFILGRSTSGPVYQEIVDYLTLKHYPYLRPIRNRAAWFMRRLQNRGLRLIGRSRRPL